MRELKRVWRKEVGDVESQDSSSSIQEDLYLVHRVLADFPQAYAALREAFRVRDEAARPAVVCSRCKCELESESGS